MKMAAGPILAALLASGSAPATFEADYQAGRLAAAETELRRAPPSAVAGLLPCRLALYRNRLAEARACLRRAGGADDKIVQGLLAESETRAGHYRDAAKAFDAAGRPALAERLRWFGPTGAYRLEGPNRASVAFVRTDPLPVVRVQVNDGPELNFIIDTGAAETVIDRPVAASARAATFGARPGLFGGGTTAPLVEGAVESLRLGPLRLRGVPVIILDTSSYGAAFGGLKISGVIGIGFLSRFRATLDYPRKRLELRARGTGARATGAGIGFWLFGDHFILAEGRMNGAAELAFIDTGLAGLGCTAPESTLRQLGIAAGEMRPGGVNGAGIAMSAAPFRADIALGPVEEKDVSCVAGPFPPQLEKLGGTRIGMLVSHAFLKPYAVTFDFDLMVLTLRKPRRG